MNVEPWFVGAVIGLITLGFLMSVAWFTIAKKKYVGPDQRFIIAAILALGVALSAGFLGNDAAASGKLPVPLGSVDPITFSAGGGFAVFVIVLLLASWIYVQWGRTEDSLSRIQGQVKFQRNFKKKLQDDLLVIWPFTYEGTRPEYKALASAVTAQVTGNMVKVQGFRVVPREELYRFEGKRPGPLEVQHHFGAGYVLYADIFDLGTKGRISATLYTPRKGAGKVSVVEDHEFSLDDRARLVNELSRWVVEKMCQALEIPQSPVVEVLTNNTQAMEKYGRALRIVGDYNNRGAGILHRSRTIVQGSPGGRSKLQSSHG